MNLHQLRFVREAVRQNYNLTDAAKALFTSQPGVSKAIIELEEELGVDIFTRHGKRIRGLTEPGRLVLNSVELIMQEIDSLKRIGKEYAAQDSGSFTIATTHTQARYVLPPVLKRFRDKYPKVRLHLHQGNSEQIADLAATDRIDFAIATGVSPMFSGLVRLPCYRWHRCIIVPHGHPLGEVASPGFVELAKYPLVTYSFSFSGPSSLVELFAAEGLTPNVALTAWDSDVIKKYVREGLGVGILANVAIDGEEDADLKVRDGSHLFPVHTTWVGFRRGVLLRGFMYDFLQMLAPHLDPRLVRRAESAESQDAVDREVAGTRIPYLR